MESLANTRLLAQPVNWIIVPLMVLFALQLLHLAVNPTTK